MIEVTWATMKDFIDTRSISSQVVIEEGVHLIRAADNFFQLSVKLLPGKHDTEIQDFTNNYSAISNSTPRELFIRQLGEDNISVSPRTLSFNSDGNFDKELNSSTGIISIRGGVLWVDKADWTLGDKIGVTIIDKNDVLGLGGTPANPTLVSTFIVDGEWCIMPNIVNELIDEAISSPIPDGLFLRLKITKGGSTTPKGILNIYAYEV